MIKPGQRHKANNDYFRINKVAEVPKHIVYDTPKWGRTRFRPTITEIQWEKNGNKEFWLPYWIGPEGKERYGQYAPMISEKQLLALLKEAIRQEFFSQVFLSALAMAVAEGLTVAN